MSSKYPDDPVPKEFKPSLWHRLSAPYNPKSEGGALLSSSIIIILVFGWWLPGPGWDYWFHFWKTVFSMMPWGGGEIEGAAGVVTLTLITYIFLTFHMIYVIAASRAYRSVIGATLFIVGIMFGVMGHISSAAIEAQEKLTESSEILQTETSNIEDIINVEMPEF